MPPPPPAPPPPLLFNKSNQLTKSSHGEPPPDRNALLSQIRKGTRLKKAETNDRSAPLIDNKASSSGSSGNASYKANGPMPIIPPGGLFSQGMPKLRPTGSRAGDNEKQNFQPSNRMLNTASALPTNAVGRSHSQPPSPASKLRQTTSNLAQSDSTGHRSFPMDINIKGPAPAPPPASQKPSFVSKQTSNAAVTNNKHPGVKRSASQSHIGPRVAPLRPPPNVRPPPPPKSANVLHAAPPAPPSKPPSVMRRQSFGVGDTYTSHQLSVINSDFAKCSGPKSLVPPPPPRNNSAPNNLNQMNVCSNSVHINKMTAAPPPPPSRPAPGHIRAPAMRPPPPPVRAPAPPPPPHRFPVHPAPPSQLKATPSHNAAPPPPIRISSVSSQQADTVSDFEARFLYKFHSAQSLPDPEKFLNIQKTYQSKVQQLKQSTRRQPPPPPPPPVSNGPTKCPRSGHNLHQPVLHIQLESRVFANNTAHC